MLVSGESITRTRYFSIMWSPIQRIEEDLFDQYELEVYLKRDDLVHGPLHGNKYRKIKYHLAECQHRNIKTLITCGGPFSNHLFATAALGAQHGFKTIGIVRGEIHANNPTVKALRKWQMDLIATSRSDYAKRNQPGFAAPYLAQYPDSYFMPEGGNHPLAQKGVGELADEIKSQQTAADYWICPVGTGCTVAGIYPALDPKTHLLALSVLKGFDTKGTIAKLLQCSLSELWKLHPIDAAFNGFGRRNDVLASFCTAFSGRHGILLDPIYTGKMMLKVYQLIKENYFPRNAKLVIIHTGGLQGIYGYNHRFDANLPVPHPTFFGVL